MAKLLAPLMSLEAKGRIGKLLIYYSKTHARSWSAQNDPKTPAQLRSRAVVRSVMKMYKTCTGLDRNYLRASYSKNWHTSFTAWLTRDSLANAQAAHDAWSALPLLARNSWTRIVP